MPLGNRCTEPSPNPANIRWRLPKSFSTSTVSASNAPGFNHSTANSFDASTVHTVLDAPSVISPKLTPLRPCKKLPFSPPIPRRVVIPSPTPVLRKTSGICFRNFLLCSLSQGSSMRIRSAKFCCSIKGKILTRQLNNGFPFASTMSVGNSLNTDS